MAEYTLKIRRYDPESGEAAHWGEYEAELPPERSVLDGILQIKDREDASIAIRCSCRAAICGSCGVRINGKSALACNTRIGDAAERAPQRGDHGRAHGQHARAQGPDRRHGGRALEEGSARGALAAAGRGAARGPGVHRGRRGDARRDPGDGLHPLRRVRIRVPVAGGRSGVRGSGRVGQGLPLRGRPARRPARGAAERPGRGPARHLQLHPLLRLRGGLPQGRGPDGPDHAPAASCHRRLRDQGLQQRLRPREGLRRHRRALGHPLRGPAPAALVRRRLAGQGPAAALGGQAAHREPAHRPARPQERQGLAEEGAVASQAARPEAGEAHLPRDRVEGRARGAEPLHRG